MRRLVVLAATLVFVAGGCAARTSVGSHVQRDLDLSAYRTFSWGDADELPAPDPRIEGNPSFHDQLQGAVEKGLALRGFAQAPSGAGDLSIHYHAAITQRIDVNRFDREHGYCYGEDCNVTVVHFEVGTIVLDVMDARANRLLWRGWARVDAGEMLGNRERMAARVREAVERTLERLPAPAAVPVKGGGR